MRFPSRLLRPLQARNHNRGVVRLVRAGHAAAGAVGTWELGIGVQDAVASDWSGSLRKAAVEKTHSKFGGAAARVGV